MVFNTVSISDRDNQTDIVMLSTQELELDYVIFFNNSVSFANLILIKTLNVTMSNLHFRNNSITLGNLLYIAQVNILQCSQTKFIANNLS
jgi:hypothetical protein